LRKHRYDQVNRWMDPQTSAGWRPVELRRLAGNQDLVMLYSIVQACLRLQHRSRGPHHSWVDDHVSRQGLW